MSIKILPKVHLLSGFLGVGKTTAIRSLLAQKKPNEKWVIIVNEFGEIGIDGAILNNQDTPVVELSGGCLCCTAGIELTETISHILKQTMPDRIIIEASGMAHASSVLDELRQAPFNQQLIFGAAITIVDPRQFTNHNYSKLSLYQDHIGIADILIASKIDLCDDFTLSTFREQVQKIFPPKALVEEVTQAQLNIAWLDTPLSEKSRYRIKSLPNLIENIQSQGYTFPVEKSFDATKLTQFFNTLPQQCQGLLRAKGIFQVDGSWVWLNWTDGNWGASEVAWRRDNRFELIAQSFDADMIEQQLQAAMMTE